MTSAVDLEKITLPELLSKSKIANLYSSSAKGKDVDDFWRRALEVFAVKTNSVVFKPVVVENYFIRMDIFPDSFQGSLERLQPSIVRKRSSLSTPAVGVIFTSILSYFSSPSSSTSEEEYINVGILDTIFNAICYESSSSMEFVYSMIDSNRSSFLYMIQNLFKRPSPDTPYFIYQVTSGFNRNDCDLLVTYLSEGKKAIVSPDKSTIKIISTDLGPENMILRDVDISRMKLKTSIVELEDKVASLQERSLRQGKKAIQLKQEGRTSAALTEMKIKKMYDNAETNISQALLNLMSAYQRIEEAQYNKIIMDAFQSATHCLKSSNLSPILAAENIDDIMSKFDDQLGEMENIQAAINTSLPISDEDEMKEYLQELENLELEEASKQIQALQLQPPPSNIPDAVTKNPTKGGISKPGKSAVKSSTQSYGNKTMDGANRTLYAKSLATPSSSSNLGVKKVSTSVKTNAQ